MRHRTRLDQLRKAAGPPSKAAGDVPLMVTPDQAEQIFDVLKDAGIDVVAVVEANAKRQGIPFDFSG